MYPVVQIELERVSIPEPADESPHEMWEKFLYLMGQAFEMGAERKKEEKAGIQTTAGAQLVLRFFDSAGNITCLVRQFEEMGGNSIIPNNYFQMSNSQAKSWYTERNALREEILKECKGGVEAALDSSDDIAVGCADHSFRKVLHEERLDIRQMQRNITQFRCFLFHPQENITFDKGEIMGSVL